MMKRFLVVLACSCLPGCAFQAQVQRFGVEYNEALAGMANEQTLLNILRASKGMPSHFTSVNRFTGSVAMRASASINGQLRGSGLARTATGTDTLTTATTRGADGALVSAVSTPLRTDSVQDVVTEGVDVYNPQVGGELTSGTQFDVQVYDQQKFYNGILSAVPPSTVEMLINQGYDRDLIAVLLIARVDVFVKENGRKKGNAVAIYRNVASERVRFQHLIACNVLDVVEDRSPDTALVPVSRLALEGDGRAGLALEHLALLDGEKLALSGTSGIGTDPRSDPSVAVVRPGTTRRAPRLVTRDCSQPAPGAIDQRQGVFRGQLSGNKTLLRDTVLAKDPTDDHSPVMDREAIVEIVFRSPEAVLRAVGEMIRTDDPTGVAWLDLCGNATSDCSPTAKTRRSIFKVATGRARQALVTARFNGAEYSIANDDIRSMQVLTIIQQLINLQKEASENALSIPVRAVP